MRIVLRITNSSPHAGHHDDFEGLARRVQSLAEGPDDRIAPPSRQRRHVEHAAHRRPASPDRPPTTELAAVTVEWSHPDQGRDLLAVEPAQLGQFGHERDGRHGADAGGRLQDAGAALQVVVACDQVRQLRLHLANELVQLLDHAADAPQHELGRGGLQTALFGGPQFDQLAAVRRQLLEPVLLFGDFLRRTRLDVLTEQGDRLGVDPIGLGQPAEPAGEVADLPRVGHGRPVSGRNQRGDDGPLITPGGLDDHQALARRRQRLKHLLHAGAVVGRGEPPAVRQHAHVQRVLGHVDSHKRVDCSVHERLPVLRMRARREVGSGGCSGSSSKNRRRSRLATAYKAPGRTRSTAGRIGSPAPLRFAGLPMPPTVQQHSFVI